MAGGGIGDAALETLSGRGERPGGSGETVEAPAAAAAAATAAAAAAALSAGGDSGGASMVTFLVPVGTSTERPEGVVERL